jgi:hypothetical protein
LSVIMGGVTERWRVIGVIEDENTHVGTLGAVFTSLAQLHRLERIPAGAERGWMIGADDRSLTAVGRLAANIRSALAAAGIHAQVQTARQVRQQNREQLQRYLLFGAVALISACIGLLAVLNAAASVRERYRGKSPLRRGEAARRHPVSILLTEALCYVLLSWGMAAAIGILAAGWVMRLISGGELLAWPFQPLAADQASGRAATPALLALVLVLLMVIAHLGAAPAIVRARRTAQGGSSLALGSPVAGDEVIRASDPGGRRG